MNSPTNNRTVVVFLGLVVLLVSCPNSLYDKAKEAVDAATQPTSLHAAAGNGQVTLTWAAVAAATSYNLYWAQSTTVSTTSGTQVSNASSPQTISGLENDTTYAFIVTSVGSYGESVASVVVTAYPSELDFVGTWQFYVSSNNIQLTDIWQFTKTSASETTSGTISGTMNCSIQTYDTSAREIQMYVNSATGWYSSYNGTNLYMTYSFSGSSFFQSVSTSLPYPSSATTGPYTKQ